jgi:hypothetical protein
MPHDKKAHEIKYSDNIYWYGNLYTVLDVAPDYEDETVTFKVGYPRKMEGDSPILETITCHLQHIITVLR